MSFLVANKYFSIFLDRPVLCFYPVIKFFSCKYLISTECQKTQVQKKYRKLPTLGTVVFISWVSGPLSSAEAPLGRGRTKRKGRKSARGGRWEEGKGFPSPFPASPARLLFLSLQPQRALYFPLPNLPYRQYPKKPLQRRECLVPATLEHYSFNHK